MSRLVSIKLAAVLVTASAAGLPAFAVAQIPVRQFQACLTIEDMTKERLDCFDALVPPEPLAFRLPPKRSPNADSSRKKTSG
jgi:hypothetical protein